MANDRYCQVIQANFSKLKTVVATEETVRWFVGKLFSCGLIDSPTHEKLGNNAQLGANAKAHEVWVTLLNRMKAGDSKNTFEAIIRILNEEQAITFFSDFLRGELERISTTIASTRSMPVHSSPSKEEEYVTGQLNRDPFSFSHSNSDDNEKKRGVEEEGHNQLSAAELVIAPTQAHDPASRLSDALQMIQLAQGDIQTKEEEMRMLKLQYEEKCKEVQRLTGELEESTRQKHELCTKIDQLEAEHSSRVSCLEREVDGLKSRVKALEDDIRDKEVAKAILEKEKAMMETKLVKKKLELSKKETENEKLKKEAAENQSRIAVYQANEEIEKAKKETEVVVTEMERLRRESLQKSETIKKLETELTVSRHSSAPT